MLLASVKIEHILCKPDRMKRISVVLSILTAAGLGRTGVAFGEGLPALDN